MMFFFGLVLLLSTGFHVSANGGSKRPPHIIYILADDLGWNDVSYHGSCEIPTPNLDALAASGMTFKHFYVSPQCTPSRASLMTGRNPTNTSLQHFVILPGQPTCLPLNITILPQYLKELGYRTHLIGKWHLGLSKKECTPIYRGFDSHFGFWNGALDYYDYTHYYAPQNMWGIDLHDGMKPIKHFRAKYATHVFTDRAEEIICEHNTSQPLLLMLFLNAPHVGNSYQPLQAPPCHVNKFMYINDTNRRTYAGMVSVLDEAVGKIFEALHKKHMLENCIIVFHSDNGAPVEGERGGYGSNCPLRGAKLRLYEGGVRVPALIWSPLLKLKKPRTSEHMMHVSDLLPTLCSAAGINVTNQNIDGIDMWNSLVKNRRLGRNEILLNIDTIFGMSALVQNKMKVVNGTYTEEPESRDLWYGPCGGIEKCNVTSMDAWVWKNGSVVKDILEETGRWLIKKPDQWRKDKPINCRSPRPSDNGGCDPTTAPCLFDLAKDPCEHRNIAQDNPEVVQAMMNRIAELNSVSLEPADPAADPNANPLCHGFTYVPWLDPEYASLPCGCGFSRAK